MRTRVRQSLLRPLLILGAERELVLGSGMLAAILIFSLNNLLLGVVGVVFWIVSLAAFQRMAKIDVQMTKIYVRHVNRKIYYPARAHVSALPSLQKKHQKV